jgi:hypothetical protein
MSFAEVRRVLGRPTLVNRRVDYGFRSRYIEYDWGYTRRTVGFIGRGSDLHAVKIGTTLRAQRTPKRVGIGSRVREILRAYPRAACVGRWYDEPDPGTWVWIGRPGAITAFHIAYASNDQPTRLGEVSEILVQERWLETTHTSPGCFPGWQSK